MRSIRLSLVLYVLVLLAAALGAVSALAFQNAHQTLLAKKAATRRRHSSIRSGTVSLPGTRSRSKMWRVLWSPLWQGRQSHTVRSGFMWAPVSSLPLR